MTSTPGATSSSTTASTTAAEVRAGKFKMPFGLEENTSATNLDFVYRLDGVGSGWRRDAIAG